MYISPKGVERELSSNSSIPTLFDFGLAAMESCGRMSAQIADAYLGAVRNYVTFAQDCATACANYPVTRSIYDAADKSERNGSAVPLTEEICDFNIPQKMAAGLIPLVTITLEVPKDFPFCHVWTIERLDGQNLGTSDLGGPDSGPNVRVLSELVAALLQEGNVRVIAKRDPHYITRDMDEKHPDSYLNWVKAIASFMNPASHLYLYSGSGPAGILASAIKEPASLTLLGCPVDSHIAMTAVDRLAVETQGAPETIRVGDAFAGAGRRIVPGELMSAFIPKEPGRTGKPGGAISQALSARHATETLDLFFRRNALMNGGFTVNGKNILDRLKTIRCPLITIGGERDIIVPSPQVEAAHALLPNAQHHHWTIRNCGHYGLVEDPALKTIIPLARRAARRQQPVFVPR